MRVTLLHVPSIAHACDPEGAHRQSSLFRDERGLTTTSMAIALLISIALIFSGAQLYRAHSAAAEVQEVADACALAAENEVAGLQTVAQTCDAVCLSLTLLAVTLYGTGLVAACIPPTESLSVKLIDWADKTVKARAQFYERACTGLNAAQRALPFLAACNAMDVAKANGRGDRAAEYAAAAILVPQGFTPLGTMPDDGLENASEAASSQVQDIRDTARAAEEAAQNANQAKERGFMEDCGAAPGYCMMERAASLAALPAQDNPVYSNVDNWSFNVALERAQAYYQRRLTTWRLEGRSTEAQADSVIRKRFYEYATEQLADAYVQDTPEGFSAYLPHLFRNTDELRATPLYTETIYPITSESDGMTMHAWSGCPRAANAVRLGSISELEANRSIFKKCPLCEFVPSSVGSVASASTSIQNGFENHYEQMRQACEEYAQARAAADPLASEVRATLAPLLDALNQVLANAGTFRIHLEPPGRNGALALAVNTAQERTDEGFSSAFVPGSSVLGTRAAISAATLVEDGTESAGSFATEAISALLPASMGTAASMAGGAWSALLRAYEDGQSALEDAVATGLDSFSHATSSGLGSWAAAALSDTIHAAGLEPADAACEKPQVLNTTHVAASDDSALCVQFMHAKASALDGSSSGTGTMGTLLNALLGQSADGAVAKEKDLPIAHISLPFGSEHTLDWVLPGQAPDTTGPIQTALRSLGDVADGLLNDRTWQ